MKLPTEDFGVGRADPKADDRPDVAEDRLEDHGVELSQVLMGEHQSDAVLAKLREHGGQALGREAVELVEVEKEVPSCRLGSISSAEASRSDVRHEQRP